MMSSLKKNTDWMYGMKGLAILALSVYHWFYLFEEPVLSKLTRIGSQGVHIFFILSSFGLYYSLVQGNKQITGYWFKKRFLKLLIPYYIAVVLTCLMIVCYAALQPDFQKTMHALGLSGESLLATIFFYRNFIEEYFFAINVAWGFVGTILLLYLCFPLLYYFYRSSPKWLFLVATLAITLLYQFVYSLVWHMDGQIFSKFFLTFFFEFALGIYLADLFIHNKEKFDQMVSGIWPFMWGVLLLGMGIVLITWGSVGLAFNDTLNAMGIFLICYNLYTLISKSDRSKIVCDWLGRYSLGFFLLHQTYMLILYKFYKDFFVGINHLWFIVYFLLMCFLAWVYHKFFIDHNPLLKKYFS